LDRQDIAPTRLMDLNDGKEWSQMDVFDLANSIAHGYSLIETAEFLCRSGTVDDVRRKAEEMGLIVRLGPIMEDREIKCAESAARWSPSCRSPTIGGLMVSTRSRSWACTTARR